MPHGITQCYLPPGRGDIPALTPAEAGTRLSDPGGMQCGVDNRVWATFPFLHPQNGDRIATVDSVTSLHAMYSNPSAGVVHNSAERQH